MTGIHLHILVYDLMYLSMKNWKRAFQNLPQLYTPTLLMIVEKRNVELKGLTKLMTYRLVDAITRLTVRLTNMWFQLLDLSE